MMPQIVSGICPECASEAAGGITISLGNGNNELSIAIISTTTG